jgi:hypothetical protein
MLQQPPEFAERLAGGIRFDSDSVQAHVSFIGACKSTLSACEALMVPPDWRQQCAGGLDEDRDLLNAELLDEPEAVGVRPVFDQFSVLHAECVGAEESDRTADRIS